MTSNVHFSSKTDLWSTPRPLFAAINQEFGFTLDVAANAENKCCDRYYSVEQDGLRQDWSGNVVWCNPPYGRELPKWVEKAATESRKPNTIVVMLIPARTDTTWFHAYIHNRIGVEVRFLRGRIKFGNSPNNAPFPSMLVIFNRIKP